MWGLWDGLLTLQLWPQLPGNCGVSCLLLLLSLQGEPMRTSWPGKQAREVPSFFLSMAALCVLPFYSLGRLWGALLSCTHLLSRFSSQK